MDLKYKIPLSSEIYEPKADRICRLYALKLRMTASRALPVRYAFPHTEQEILWPMLMQSVAEHSFLMAQIIGPVYLEFLDLLQDKNIPVELAESEALHHDDAEALTGDAATDVDGVTRDMKDAAEAKSIDRQYYDMVCYGLMRLKHQNYEAKDSYLSKFVKMLDAVELVYFTQYCARNGVGMIRKGSGGNEFVLMAFGEAMVIDGRTYKEVRPYFENGGRQEVRISEIMYDHSLPRLEKLKQSELIELFKLLCARAFEFPFEEYSLEKLPMDFANFA